MIFKDSTKYQPIEHPFNWCADYNDGKYYSEFDLETLEANDFYQIDVDNTTRFGLFSVIGKFFFEKDGSFKLKGKRVTVEYHTKDETIYNLTHNDEKGLITYKDAYSEYRNKVKRKGRKIKTTPSVVSAFNFGYKTLIEKDGVQFYFQPIVKFPIPRTKEEAENFTPYMEVKLTSNKNLDGELVFKVRDVEVDRFNAPLEVNYSGIINWNIK